MRWRAYIPREIEPKWRNRWEEALAHRTKEDAANPKFYCLDMFPYPSGEGLHVGHWRGYVLSDVWSRYKKLQGFNVLHPMGWDAFGLPAENDAIKKGIHPEVSTQRNIANFKRQLIEMGAMYDWEREVNTSDPEFYKYTQWIFIQMFKKGLAYRQKMPINWCPSCKTGLANEEVVDGRCERCDTEITKKPMEQWMLKITEYADRLLEDLNKLEWPDKVKKMQANWIGKSEGASIQFPVCGVGDCEITVFTTRPDTLFGATYLVLAPEHPLVNTLTTAEQRGAVEEYVKQATRKSNVDRMIQERQKTGVFTGSYARNPINNEVIPIWIADYVLVDYGTGAIMAVPAHDSRDYEFGRVFHLPMRRVVAPTLAEADEPLEEAYSSDSGVLVNSGMYSGMNIEEGKAAILRDLSQAGSAKVEIRYKLRDWVFSRQRYWGEPIPIIHCECCGEVPVPEEDLPVRLPRVEKYQPSGTGESPLALMEDWVSVACPSCGQPAKRETNTMPQWAGSSWYFLRYCDPHNKEKAWDKSKADYWLPVDFYVGGVEHAVLHLLYARFYTKFLFDIGVITFDEPFKQLFNQGMVCKNGVKMSKSKGNSVSPDKIVGKYGTDSLRMYELFMGPPEQDSEWDDTGIEGVYRFLTKVWQLAMKSVAHNPGSSRLATEETNELVKGITERIENRRLNTTISLFMSYVNVLNKECPEGISRDNLEKFIILLAPFAPHFAEEIWEAIGHKDSLFSKRRWPSYDPTIAQEVMMEIPIQVNGRVRGTITIAKGSSEEEVIHTAESLDVIRKYLDDKGIRKVVYIPEKVLNFVV